MKPQTKQAALAALKRAGYACTAISQTTYYSSVLDIYVGVDLVGCLNIRVTFRGRESVYFDHTKYALQYIRRIMSIQCVSTNEWALKRPARGQLKLVAS